MNITPHFSLEELTKTSHPIKNAPGAAEIVNLCALCHYLLEPLRISVKSPIYINSGYRCPELNKAVGGVANSQHLTGCAADIRVNSENHGALLFTLLKSMYYCDQLLYEKSTSAKWLHVSFSWTPRHYFRENYRVL